jgi:hypothetical protein
LRAAAHGLAAHTVDREAKRARTDRVAHTCAEARAVHDHDIGANAFCGAINWRALAARWTGELETGFQENDELFNEVTTRVKYGEHIADMSTHGRSTSRSRLRTCAMPQGIVNVSGWFGHRRSDDVGPQPNV